MRKTFPYLEKDGQHFPLVEVTLSFRQRALKVLALVDSGASFSVFRPEVAEYLGIIIERGKKVYLTGIGGRILGYLHVVTLEIGNIKFRCSIVFSPEFNVSFNLLGRDNFFLPLVISFFERRRKVVVRSL